MPAPDSSLRPHERPESLVRVAASAVPEGQPAIVREKATQPMRYNLKRPMLIGIFGAESAPSALIRLPSGKIEQVARGDRVGGETVMAIDAETVILARGGRSRRLAMP